MLVGRLEKAVHDLSDFNNSVSVVDKGGKVVLLHDAVGDSPDWYTHVLVVVHWDV